MTVCYNKTLFVRRNVISHSLLTSHIAKKMSWKNIKRALLRILIVYDKMQEDRDELKNELLNIKKSGCSECENKTVSYSEPLQWAEDFQSKKKF